jgi:hypothetical protein
MHHSSSHTSHRLSTAPVPAAPEAAHVPERLVTSWSEIWSEGQTITAIVPRTGALPSALTPATERMVHDPSRTATHRLTSHKLGSMPVHRKSQTAAGGAQAEAP